MPDKNNPTKKQQSQKLHKLTYQNVAQEDHTLKIDSADILEGSTLPHVQKIDRNKSMFSNSNICVIFFVVVLVVGFLGYFEKEEIKEPIFYEIELLKQTVQLPFCLIIIPSQKHPSQTINSSISTQTHKNHLTILASDSTHNYSTYKKQIEQSCKPNSFIMFVTSPLKQNALAYINKQLNYYRSWVFYSKDMRGLEIVGFYYRIYQLMELNDFDNSYQQYRNNNNKEMQTWALMDLCQDHKHQLIKQNIIEDIQQWGYFHVRTQDYQKLLTRKRYAKILRLSQDFPIDIDNYMRAKLNSEQEGLYSRFSFTHLTEKHMRRALDRQQLLYLPQNHPIQILEHQQYTQQYKIDTYTQPQKQIRFCVTVLTRNNMQNHRYLKVLISIAQQKYENYHIVFIDDSSTDETMNKSIQYMKKIKFPQNRVKFVQNLERNYATYNIINAAFNYCGEDDVQMLVDGDDEFIGRYAFNVMNSAYQQKEDLWVAYSNGKTNFYAPGLSKSYTSDRDHIINGKRLASTFIGPIRTWRVKLIYHIPIENHKFRLKYWLDTAYDDSLAHPLIQLSRYNRTQYIPEIFYEYNTEYGNNDNSNQQKLKHRLQIYTYILSLPVLDRLETLQGSIKQKNVDKELTGDKDIKYKTLSV